MKSLAGEHGPAAREAAKAHVRTCASCRAGVDALVAPSDSLVRLAATTEPATVGRCPELEDLACWCTGDTLRPDDVKRIALHVSGCEACAFMTAQLRLELALSPERPFGGLFEHRNGSAVNASVGSAGLGAPVIAQVVGGLLLVLISATVLLPKLGRLEFLHEAPVYQRHAQRPPDPAEWPLQASLEFRLKGAAEKHSLMFPHYPPVQLAENYEYAFHFTSRRTGWLLLFSVDQDRRLSLLVPGGAPSSRIPGLEAGRTLRFPPEPAWEPVAANSGRREFYAVYLDSVVAAEELVTKARLPDASGQIAATLTRKLKEMVVAGGCAYADRPCVLTLEYEVF